MSRVRLVGVECEDIEKGIDQMLTRETRSDGNEQRSIDLLCVEEQVREICAYEPIHASTAPNQIVKGILEILSQGSNHSCRLKNCKCE